MSSLCFMLHLVIHLIVCLWLPDYYDYMCFFLKNAIWDLLQPNFPKGTNKLLLLDKKKCSNSTVKCIFIQINIYSFSPLFVIITYAYFAGGLQKREKNIKFVFLFFLGCRLELFVKHLHVGLFTPFCIPAPPTEGWINQWELFCLMPPISAGMIIALLRL